MVFLWRLQQDLWRRIQNQIKVAQFRITDIILFLNGLSVTLNQDLHKPNTLLRWVGTNQHFSGAAQVQRLPVVGQHVLEMLPK